MNVRLSKFGKGAIAAAALLFAAQASAATYDINQQLNGEQIAKVATLDIVQSGEDTLFTLTGSFEGLAEQAFIKEIFFTGASGEFVAGAGNTIQSAPMTAFFTDANNAGVAYNWRVRFPTASNGDRFTGLDTASWIIKGTQAEDFSAPMLKMNGGNSVTRAVALTLSPVPEAGTWLMMLAGLGVLGFARRRTDA